MDNPVKVEDVEAIFGTLDEAQSNAVAVWLDVAWANPAFTSPATSAAALSQLASVFPWLSESTVALEFAGFSQAEIVADCQNYLTSWNTTHSSMNRLLVYSPHDHSVFLVSLWRLESYFWSIGLGSFFFSAFS